MARELGDRGKTIHLWIIPYRCSDNVMIILGYQYFHTSLNPWFKITAY